VKRGDRLWLVAVLLLAGWWRFHALGRWSLDGDEIYSWWDVQTMQAGEPWPFGARSHPMGYLLIQLCVSLGGLSEFVVRLGPALAGFAVVPALLFMRRDVLPRRVGLAAATLAALSPWLIYHSQSARFYAPLLLFSTLATLWALPGVRQRPWASGLAWFGAVLCHPTALMLGPGLEAALALRPVRWRPLVLSLVLALAGLVAVFALDDGSLAEVVQRVVDNVDPGHYGALHFVAGLGYNVGPMLGLLAALGILWAGRASRTQAPQSPAGPTRGLWLTLSVCAVLPPAALLGAAWLGLSMHQRYAMCSLPALLLLAGFGWQRCLASRRGLGMALGLGALLVPGPGLWAYSADGNRHDTRGVAAVLAAQASPGDILVVDEHSAVGVYLHGEPGFADTKIVEAPPSAKKQSDFLGNKQTVWVAVKLSRLGSAYGADFTQWLDKHFIEMTQVGQAPPPLVRHDNRYVIYRRTKRLTDPPQTEPPAEPPR
jgi:hypothetical protein